MKMEEKEGALRRILFNLIDGMLLLMNSFICNLSGKNWKL
jgi:hypothetical protein